MKAQIFFTAYLAGENNDYEELRPLHGRLIRIWDGHMDTAILTEEVGLSNDQIQKFYTARVNWTSDHTEPLEYHTEVPPLDPNERADVFLLHIWGEVENYKKQFALALEDMAHDSSSVGGDDSYFDYYPDRWFVYHQIAQALGMKEEYEKARQIPLTGRYVEDDEKEDLIPAW